MGDIQLVCQFCRGAPRPPSSLYCAECQTEYQTTYRDVVAAERDPSDSDDEERPCSESSGDDLYLLLNRQEELVDEIAKLQYELATTRGKLKRQRVETYVNVAENDDDCTCLDCEVNYGSSSIIHTCVALFPDK